MLPGLISQTLARQELTSEMIREMFDVFCENFERSSLEMFERDLKAKNWVILIRGYRMLHTAGLLHARTVRDGLSGKAHQRSVFRGYYYPP